MSVMKNFTDRYISKLTTCLLTDDIINKFLWYNTVKDEDIYDCGILIEDKYRGKGYSKPALKLLIKEANKNNIKYLYDTFEKSREKALKLFLDVGFEMYEKTTVNKFNKEVECVIIRIDTNKITNNTD